MFKHHANVPTKDFLQVYWDANESNSYPGSGADVTDIATASSNTVPGALSGSVAFDATSNAWTFDGNADFIEGTLPSSFAGDQPHTAAFWFKRASNHDGTLFTISPSAGEASQNSKVIQVRTNDSAGYSLSYIFWSNDIRYNPTLVDDTWYHLTATYAGGGGTPTKKLLYLNGALLNPVSTSGSVIGNALAVDASSKMRIGARINHSSMNYLNGAVASFRLYTRPLIKEQVETLYDYEKVRFGHVSSLDVTLHKGSLAVGVAEPSRDDRLAVAGRVKADSAKVGTLVDRNDVVVYEQTGPHDRPLTKYPEVAMIVDAETASGYKGYKVTTNGNYSGRSGWEAFDSNPFGSTWATENGTYSHSGDGADANTSGQTAGTFTANGISYTGHWIKLELVNAIKLQRAFINAYNLDAGGDDRRPKKGVFLGSNDDSVWDLVHAFDGDLGWGRLLANQYGATINFSNISTRYKYILLLVEEKQLPSSSGATRIEIFNIEFYGTEEGDASTDSKLTSVLNTPSKTHLEVYWDAADSNSYPGAGTEVVDLSGNGVKGTLANGIGFDSTYNAWTFDGSGDVIISEATSLASGNPTLSFSVWFKTDSVSSGSNSIFLIGHSTSAKNIGFRVHSSGKYRFYVQGGATDESVTTDITAKIGIWTHVTVVYTGLRMKLYIDGKYVAENTNTSSNLNLDSGSKVVLGNYMDSNGAITGTATYNGSIANARLFSKVLSTEQVKELYAYDAVRFGHRASNSVSLHKGNLGVGVTAPTSRFEVAGNERIQEYPPRAMTGYSTYMEGHGVFSVVAGYGESEGYPASHGFHAWKVFDDTLSGKYHGGNDYGGTDYAYNAGKHSLGGIEGDYIILNMPKVKAKAVKMSYGGARRRISRS